MISSIINTTILTVFIIGEIEKGLTATQEVNVNLQVLLEKAVNKQKETDVYATRAMRHIHTNLANVCSISKALLNVLYFDIPLLFNIGRSRNWPAAR